MTVESDVYNTLKGLVNNRVYPNTFPQPNNGLPLFPAIRYQVVSTEIDLDICGDGDETTDTVSVQLDLVCDTSLEVTALRASVRETMKLYPNPCALQDTRTDYDSETKTHRVSMDYSIYLSSI